MTSEPQLDSLLKQMADGHRPALPSPDVIWWRARILRKQERKQRIEQPIRIVRGLAIVVCVAVCLGLLAANWQSLQEMLGRENWVLWPLGIAAAIILGATIPLFRPAKS